MVALTSYPVCLLCDDIQNGSPALIFSAKKKENHKNSEQKNYNKPILMKVY